VDRSRIRKRARARIEGSDPEAEMVEEYHILREIYKNTDLPMWVIKKVCAFFLKEMRRRLLHGDYIYFSSLGAFVPFRRCVGTKRFKTYDPTKSHVTYKWKGTARFKEDLLKSTIRKEGEDVNISQSGG
jgi:hypothetical protein